MVTMEQRVGTVAELHALDPFGDGSVSEPTVWWCRPTDDAIVLGSRQPDGLVGVDACRRAGLSVVRRRSGGGAVVMRRDSILWVDHVLPAGVAPDDVRASMVWIGEQWCEVLASLVDLPLAVHRGTMRSSAWSELVCFSGVGPGEVLTGDDKLVGLSQRRTRRGIRIQGLVYGESVAAEYAGLFRGDVPASPPDGQGWVPGLDHRAVVDGLVARMTRS